MTQRGGVSEGGAGLERGGGGALGSGRERGGKKRMGKPRWERFRGCLAQSWESCLVNPESRSH